MHRHLTRKRNVARERKAQTTARPVANATVADETIGPVEQFGRTQAGPLARANARIRAFFLRQPGPRRVHQIGNLASPCELAAELKRRFRPAAPIPPLDATQYGPLPVS